MATWGDFIKDINVVRLQSTMYVKVDEVITLWDERNTLREEVARLRTALESERESCAEEVEEFAQACMEEAETPEVAAAYLRAAANLIREKDTAPTEDAQPAD